MFNLNVIIFGDGKFEDFNLSMSPEELSSVQFTAELCPGFSDFMQLGDRCFRVVYYLWGMRD